MEAVKLFAIKIINWIPLNINTSKMVYNSKEFYIQLSNVTLPYALL